MRIGGKGSYVDNAHAGGMFVGVKDDGTLCDFVCNQYGIKNRFFNDIDFSNHYQIPSFDSIVKFACSVGNFVPHCRLLALDVALQDNGRPKLIEFNVATGSYSMWLFQLTVGTALGNFTQELLDYWENISPKLKYDFILQLGLTKK